MRNVLSGVSVVALLTLAACGDGETNDRRGYTKAPLERPSVLIEAERRTDMDRLGIPNRPRGDTLTVAVPDTAAS